MLLISSVLNEIIIWLFVGRAKGMEIKDHKFLMFSLKMQFQ